MAQVSVKIIYDTKSHADADSICEHAAELGLNVEQIIPVIGAVFGSCDDSVMDKLANLDGVLRVSAEGTFQHPPLSPDKPQ